MESFAWTGATVLTVLFVLRTGAFVISLARSDLGRGILAMGALLVIVLWGVLSVLWLLATKVA